jgi:hypothetical protein
MIYLPVMNYNLPGSFGADAEFHPRLADGRGNGKFIISCVVFIGIITVNAAMMANPFVPQVLPVFLNPFLTVVEFVILVAQSRSMAVIVFFIKMFVSLDDLVLVHNRLVIRTAALVF